MSAYRRMISSIVVALAYATAFGQISLTTSGVPYVQDFNTLANTGTSSTTPNGWGFVESGNGANLLYTAGTGSSTSGDTYSFGASANTERAFGGLQSGSVVPTIGASFINNTGATITSLAVLYTGEQWRCGAIGRADRLDFQLSTNATSLTTGAYVDYDNLDFSSPSTTATGALDGNAPANRASIALTITGLNIPNGSSFWIRWLDFNATGSDDGLAVDDFWLTPFVASSPTATTLLSSLNPSNVGANVTFTASVISSGNPVLNGSVTFKEGATTLAANVALNGSGQAAFSTSSLTQGVHEITAYYNGAAGFQESSGSISQTVNSITVPPSITCSANITVQNAMNACSQSVAFSVTATGIPTPTIVCKIGNTTITSPHVFPVGVTTVNCTASNGVGTPATCSFTVTVIDGQAPTIACPGNIVARPTSLSGAVVNYDLPVGTDNCSATTDQTVGLASGSLFPVGITTNTFVTTDGSGNTASCSFTVEVLDPYCASNKVVICHKGKELCVSVNAMGAHLRHGDFIGPCSSDGDEKKFVDLPADFVLDQNYPNPFNPTTTISYALPSHAHVTLRVFDMLGRQVAELVNESVSAGHHSVEFDASRLASGLYFYRLSADAEGGRSFTEMRKLMLVK